MNQISPSTSMHKTSSLDLECHEKISPSFTKGNGIEVSIGEKNLLWYILLQGKQPSKKVIRKNSNNDDSMSELSDKGDTKMEFEEDLSDESLVEVEDESPQCSQGTFNSFSQSTSEMASSEVSSVAILSSKAALSKTDKKKKKRKSAEAFNEKNRSTKKKKKSKTQTMTTAETEKSKIKSVKKKQKKQRRKAQLIKQVKEQVSSEEEDDQCAA